MEKTNISVNFANFNYAFIVFQNQYKNLCQEISKLNKNHFIKIQNNGLKMADAFINEYLVYIKNRSVRNKIGNSINNLSKDINLDIEYYKLCNESNLSHDKIIVYKTKYYNYYIRLMEIIGFFGDELSSTFMPTKSDREKYFKYSSNNSFFEEFTDYKKNVSYRIANFDIKNFDDCFLYLIGFYYAYYLFIDEKSKYLIENQIKSLLNLLLNKSILKIILEDHQTLTETQKKLLARIDKIIHKSILKIFFRCNYSYSSYGITPRIEEVLNIDTTLI